MKLAYSMVLLDSVSENKAKVISMLRILILQII